MHFALCSRTSATPVLPSVCRQRSVLSIRRRTINAQGVERFCKVIRMRASGICGSVTAVAASCERVIVVYDTFVFKPDISNQPESFSLKPVICSSYENLNTSDSSLESEFDSSWETISDLEALNIFSGSVKSKFEGDMLTIEGLRNHYNSCFTCGVSWYEDHVSLDCLECGGYAMQRPCPECDGQCESVWRRDLAASHDNKRAHWEGECKLTPAVKQQNHLLKDVVQSNVPGSEEPTTILARECMKSSL